MEPRFQRVGGRFLTVATIVVTTVAMLVVVPAAPTSADAGVSSDQFNLGLAPEVTGAPGVPAGYIRLWDMAVAWRDVNPAPGVFTWDVLDQRIAQVEAAGAKVLYVAGLTPLWAAANPDDGDPRWGAGSASAPADPNTFAVYISAVMQRYGGRIAAVEVWNEANLKTFWTGTPDQMADLTQLAYNAVKAASGGTQVFAASTTTRLPHSVKTFFGPYAAALKARTYPIDGWTIHTYPAANAGPVERYDAITAWRKMLSDSTGKDASALGKTVWDTEINYGLAGPGTGIPHQDFDGATGATYLARTYIDSIRQGIAATFWYLWTAGDYGLLGVQMHAGTTQVNSAYNRVRDWTAGATFTSCADSAAVVRCYFVKGDPFFIAMSKTSTAASYNDSPTLTAEQWDGQVINPAGHLPLGLGPVRFTCGAGVDKALCRPRTSLAPAPAPPGRPPEQGPPGVPGAPTGVKATPGDGQVTVTWTAPASNGRSPLRFYHAYAFSPDFQRGCSAEAPATTCTIQHLKNGVPVRVYVVADNILGYGPNSPYTRPVTPTADTKPPVVTLRVPGDIPGIGDIIGIGAAVNVSWSVYDDSKQAKWTLTLYSGGAGVDYLSSHGRLVKALGDKQESRVDPGSGDGPFYVCVSAADDAGNKTKLCKWLSIQVPVPRVSNGCGGAQFGPGALAVQNWLLDTQEYGGVPVDFRVACNLHDAGYGGLTVYDPFFRRVVDYRTWTRADVDAIFRLHLRRLCHKYLDDHNVTDDQMWTCTEGLPLAQVSVTVAAGLSPGARAYFEGVREHALAAFDTDVTKPGTQTDNMPSTSPPGGGRNNT